MESFSAESCLVEAFLACLKGGYWSIPRAARYVVRAEEDITLKRTRINNP